MARHLLPRDLADRCGGDGEFGIASRFWTGGFRFVCDDEVVTVRLRDGQKEDSDQADDDTRLVTLTGPANVWAELLAPVPRRLMNDSAWLVAAGALVMTGENLTWSQYYPAIARAIELARGESDRDIQTSASSTNGFTPVGRYVGVTVDDIQYRVYVEEAGQGIPLLLQHTAGCHGSQWRHLMECKAITDHFRLIAYDLPYHGKSLPPVGPKWWAEPYLLRGGFLRSFVPTLSARLHLDRPVFMGCSVGGMLALDLARYHPQDFRAVVSLEGGLKVPHVADALPALWHPQVSNDYKARLMNGLMSPTSPEPFRKETSMVYAAGWPPVFAGDLHYYTVDFDLRDEASRIDTAQVAVHILSGEYDGSGTVEMGIEAHHAIAGSSHTVMQGIGHFPMSENPDVFLNYILPILDQIRQSD